MQLPTHALARDARSVLYLKQPQLFLKRLKAELTLLETDALQYGQSPAARLNGSSDISWERQHPELFAHSPEISFFDYTKLYRRVLNFLEGIFPPNYHLTFSADAKSKRHSTDILNRGGNVAAVFWPQLPRTWWGFPVIDGDLHDARFLDPTGVIVGLRAKGLARVDTSDFTFRPCPTCQTNQETLTLVSVTEDSHRSTIHSCNRCNFTLRSRWKLTSTVKRAA